MKKITAIFATLALAAVATPASAYVWFPTSSSDVTVSVSNSANVTNDVDTKADTGDNTSTGGSARSKARASGFFSDANSTANGGDGGDVDTGDALSTTYVTNGVNNNTVKVKASCGCNGDIVVGLSNSAVVSNDVETRADSGDNSSAGARAKSKAKASYGGDATSESTGGEGGKVVTGKADSLSDVQTYVNTNVVRVRR